MATPGFFGKLPARGDFVGRRLEAGFRNGFDAWLQGAIAGSREALGEGWLPAYLESPVWRFAMGAAVCGDAAAVGVMMPSVDRVGRYFPLVVAASLPGADPWAMLASAAEWLEAAEGVVLGALEDDADLEGFDAAVMKLGVPAYGAGGGAAGSVWSMAGSEKIAACTVVCDELPDAAGFAAFLDGGWDRWGWRTLPAAADGSPVRVFKGEGGPLR